MSKTRHIKVRRRAFGLWECQECGDLVREIKYSKQLEKMTCEGCAKLAFVWEDKEEDLPPKPRPKRLLDEYGSTKALELARSRNQGSC